MGIHDFLYKNPELPSRAVAVYFYLEDRANANGECWPSIKTIARELSISDRTVRRAIQDLQKAKLIRKEYAYRSNGSNTSNRYYIV